MAQCGRSAGPYELRRATGPEQSPRRESGPRPSGRYRPWLTGIPEEVTSMTSRRFFLRNSALAMVGAGTAPLWLERALYAADAPARRKKILVAIFQRGAADGLNVVDRKSGGQCNNQD